MSERYHRVTSHDPEIRWAVEEIYDRSFFLASERPYWKRTSGARRSVEASPWALDTRAALAHSHLVTPIASAMARILVDEGVTQIAGSGYGSFFLVGAILQATPGLTAGVVRESRKQHGFRRRIEGDLSPGVETIIIDDLVSSGRSALRAAAELRIEGFNPAGVLAIFVYAWKHADVRLAKHDLSLRTLAALDR